MNFLKYIVSQNLNESKKQHPWEKSALATSPNISISRIQAKKQTDGKYKLFYVGTHNEVFPGEVFRSPNEARQFFKVQQIKAQNSLKNN